MKAYRIIETDQDYTLVLSRLEQLVESGPVTPDTDEVAILSTLVELYENEHYPINFSKPADAIKFMMEHCA